MKNHVSVAEQRRLQTLHSYPILDTALEDAIDDLVQLAARICATPIAMVTLLDEHRQCFKSCLGLPMRETDRALAFCDYTVRGTTPFIVPKTGQDPRFAENTLVLAEPALHFYAGIPLVAPNGDVVGTLSVMDHQSRE